MTAVTQARPLTKHDLVLADKIFPAKPTSTEPRVLIIGANWFDDQITLEVAAGWFGGNGRKELAYALRDRTRWDVYDMTTKPEKGDALDHLDDAPTALVVALHLYGIDKLPRSQDEPLLVEMASLARGNPPFYCWCKKNVELLGMCMDRRLPLVAQGDQPWKGMQKRTEMHPNRLYLYEVNQ